MVRNFLELKPLVAILRGLEPECAVQIVGEIVATGFEIVEVPLNSPQPFDSIEAIAREYGDRVLVGAGTVLRVDQVDRLADIGAKLVVSPNCNPNVIRRSIDRGMVSLPGVLTPSEMFSALDSGATGLKIFPTEFVPPTALKAMCAVLPSNVPIFAVGGIGAGNMTDYLKAGATGFGMGGAIFKPGKSSKDVAADAARIVEAFDNAMESMAV